MKRVLFALVTLSAVTACSGIFDSKQPSIAGHYQLSSIDNLPIPCCSQTDSTGARVTIVSGALSLGSADPETFVATPAGYMAASCVHVVTNGDTTKFPPCGDGAYTLTLTKRYDYPNGSSQTTPTVISGKYTWSARDPALITLIGASMGGTIVGSGSQVQFALQAVNVMGYYGTTYAFTGAN